MISRRVAAAALALLVAAAPGAARAEENVQIPWRSPEPSALLAHRIKVQVVDERRPLLRRHDEFIAVVDSPRVTFGLAPFPIVTRDRTEYVPEEPVDRYLERVAGEVAAALGVDARAEFPSSSGKLEIRVTAWYCQGNFDAMGCGFEGQVRVVDGDGSVLFKQNVEERLGDQHVRDLGAVLRRVLGPMIDAEEEGLDLLRGRRGMLASAAARPVRGGRFELRDGTHWSGSVLELADGARCVVGPGLARRIEPGEIAWQHEADAQVLAAAAPGALLVAVGLRDGKVVVGPPIEQAGGWGDLQGPAGPLRVDLAQADWGFDAVMPGDVALPAACAAPPPPPPVASPENAPPP
jgi:hypothetical protein